MIIDFGWLREARPARPAFRVQLLPLPELHELPRKFLLMQRAEREAREKPASLTVHAWR